MDNEMEENEIGFYHVLVVRDVREMPRLSQFGSQLLTKLVIECCLPSNLITSEVHEEDDLQTILSSSHLTSKHRSLLFSCLSSYHTKSQTQNIKHVN